MGIKVISPPTAEPISIEEARLHLRLDAYDSPPVHPDDSIVTALISAAREWAENFTGRAISPVTLEIALDEFPRLNEGIELPRPPLISVDSVRYTDEDGDQQTMATSEYSTDTYQEPSWLMPAQDTDWPSTDTVFNAVKIRYEAGYSTPGDSPDPNPLPKSIKQAILLMLSHLYENREETSIVKLEQIPLGAEALLRPYRLYNGFA